MRRTLFALLLLVGTMGGCDDEETVRVIPPPLDIRQVVPADRAQIGPDVTNLSVTFNRGAQDGSVRMVVHPTPPSAGEIQARSGGRNYTWFEVDVQRPDAYYWFIDAWDLPLPNVVRFRTERRTESVGFRGAIASADTNQVDPLGTAIFALPADAPFNPLDPSSFLDTEPLAVAVASILSGPNRASYVLSYMESGTAVQVIAIQDTNGDLVYDPSVDWWDYQKEPEGIGPELIVAAEALDPAYRAVDLEIRPPASP